MKTYKKPAASKLVAKFDNELMNILVNDLKLFMAKNPFSNSKKQAMVQSTLSVA
ncbi:hypothetical protein KXD93_17095 [Mucilaginibacter sp. BJC16-A38]|uniref:hypothetical protein n=1 Tax=Mucilaginibacter phenanthrenivorans TaxID=1234842 RepID=UPI002157948B|nr:hypothetical protein [Mucilaginibacter phenanthrenivorans]MCR8559377.1 hypothetical protein [Mucilaginibacter phenanthrenivorans]